MNRRLGFGGMGEVWLTADGHAVKRLLPHLAKDRRFLDLFLAEIKVTAQLSHPNIVQVLDFGEDADGWFVKMEYVEGADLRAVAKLPVGLAAQVGSQAAAALDYAHHARDRQGRALKVVHRDVSPHNVLVSVDGQVKLIDFGVARALEGVPGKAAYLAPEVAEGGAATPASDQFALGVVLWELLTGKRLFKGPSDAVTLQRVVACEVAPTGTGLDEVVLRALAKEPAGRFTDCAALKQALEDALMDVDGPSSAADLGAAVRELRS